MIRENAKDNPSFEGNLQLVWDTGSTGAIKKCPRYYELSVLEGWVPKSESVHLFFGHVVHSTFEEYEKAKVDGDDHDAALRRALRHALSRTGEYKKVAQCLKCGMIRDAIEELPKEKLVCWNCNHSAFRNYERKFVPWTTDDKNKNRWTLIRTIIWYLDYYKDGVEETVIMEDGTPAVEVWFRFPLEMTSPGGQQYILSGHIDKIVRYDGVLRFRDLKTSKNTIASNYFEKYSPDNQMSQYTLGGRIAFDEPLAGGIIDAAQVAVDFTKFQRGFVDRSKAQMEEWLLDIQYWIKMAEQFVEQDYWPMNDTACHHYGGCDFKGICNKDPSIRKQFLTTHFKRKTWNPLEKRE